MFTESDEVLHLSSAGEYGSTSASGHDATPMAYTAPAGAAGSLPYSGYEGAPSGDYNAQEFTITQDASNASSLSAGMMPTGLDGGQASVPAMSSPYLDISLGMGSMMPSMQYGGANAWASPMSMMALVGSPMMQSYGMPSYPMHYGSPVPGYMPSPMMPSMSNFMGISSTSLDGQAQMAASPMLTGSMPYNSQAAHMGDTRSARTAAAYKARLIDILNTNPSMARKRSHSPAPAHAAAGGAMKRGKTQLSNSVSHLLMDEAQISKAEQKDGVWMCRHPGCDRSFTRVQNLHSHARCHLEVAPHQCDSCNASFKRATDLQRHIRTLHSAHKPWSCDACGKGFGRSDALKRHTASKSSKHGCPVLLGMSGRPYAAHEEGLSSATSSDGGLSAYLNASPSGMPNSANSSLMMGLHMLQM
jgi:hypothetical protein